MSIHHLINEHNAICPQPEKLSDFTPLGIDGQSQYDGYNLKFSAVSPDNRKWFIKVCGHCNSVFDINQREALCSLFGSVLAANVVKAWAIPHPGISHPAGKLRDEVIESVTCMEYLNGNTVKDNRHVAANIIRNNPGPIADLFALFHWLGDEDRGTMDVMQVGDRIVFVDNGLCGPAGRSILRGAHPAEGSFQKCPDQILKKCYPGKPSFTRELFEHQSIDVMGFFEPKIISRIEEMPAEDVALVVEAVGSNSPMNSDLITIELIKRQQTIRNDYRTWIENVCKMFNINVGSQH